MATTNVRHPTSACTLPMICALCPAPGIKQQGEQLVAFLFHESIRRPRCNLSPLSPRASREEMFDSRKKLNVQGLPGGRPSRRAESSCDWWPMPVGQAEGEKRKAGAKGKNKCCLGEEDVGRVVREVKNTLQRILVCLSINQSTAPSTGCMCASPLLLFTGKVESARARDVIVSIQVNVHASGGDVWVWHGVSASRGRREVCRSAEAKGFFASTTEKKKGLDGRMPA